MPIAIELAPLLVGLVTALGGGAGLMKLADWIISARRHASSRAARQSAADLTSLAAALAREETNRQLADTEALERRRLQEYAARLRVQLIRYGLEPEADRTNVPHEGGCGTR